MDGQCQEKDLLLEKIKIDQELFSGQTDFR